MACFRIRAACVAAFIAPILAAVFEPSAALAQPEDPDGSAQSDLVLINPAPRDRVVAYGLRDQPVSSVGSSVTVISADDIEAGQYSFVSDALKLAPGVAVARNGGYGGFAGARIRGGSTGQTLVVIDGVAMNDASAPQGGYNFANLDVADVERIEVLRGPQSLIWGADAIGGVIYVKTKEQGRTLSAYAEGGSRAAFRGGATAFAASGASHLRGTVSGVRTDGISRASAGSENDGYRSLSASISAGAPLGGGSRISLTARIADSHADLDGFPPPTFTFADTAETEDTTEYALAAKIDHRAGGAYEGVLTVSASGVERSNADNGVETFSARGRRQTAHYWGAYRFSDNFRVAGGAEFERAAARTSGVDDHFSSAAVFAFIEANPVRRVTLSAGARRDEFTTFKGATTSRIAAVWTANDGGGSATRLRAGWGQGFRAPTLFELHFDQFGVVPNPNLRPERANGFDAGIEHDFSTGGATFRATYFRQRVKDQIDFDFAGAGYFNIDRVKSEGVEVEAEAALGASISARLVYSFIDARDAVSGARILRTPRHSGTATISAAPTKRLDLAAAATFNGRETDVPAGNDPFVKVDLRASYALSDTLEAYGRIENLFDADYEDVSGYGELGVSAFAGVRVSL